MTTKETKRDVLIDVLVHLIAAVSILKRGRKKYKKAVASDTMFDIMISDYDKAIKHGQKWLKENDNI